LREEIVQKGSVREFEAKLRKKDGVEMDCLITSTVRLARDKTILGYQGIIRDIQVNDINKRPDLETCAINLEKMNK